MTGCVQKEVAVTASGQPGTIVIVNQGGKDAGQINQFNITVDGQINLTQSGLLDKKTGSTMMIPAEPGIHRVIVRASFNDQSTQKILDANVTVSETADYWFKKAKTEENAMNYSMAVLNYDKALALDSRHQDSLWGKGYCLAQQGQWEKALANNIMGTSFYPENAVFWNNKGVALHNLGRYEDAMYAYTTALKLDPQYKTARANMKITTDKIEQLPAGRNEVVKIFSAGASTLRVSYTTISPPLPSPNSNSTYRFSYSVRFQELGGNTFVLTNKSQYVHDYQGYTWTTWGLPVTKNDFDHSIPAYGSYTYESWYQSPITTCEFCGGKAFISYFGHDVKNIPFEIKVEINFGRP
jgi:tetratricopeptide (TPR) repeat protein